MAGDATDLQHELRELHSQEQQFETQKRNAESKVDKLRRQLEAAETELVAITGQLNEVMERQRDILATAFTVPSKRSRVAPTEVSSNSEDDAECSDDELSPMFTPSSGLSTSSFPGANRGSFIQPHPDPQRTGAVSEESKYESISPDFPHVVLLNGRWTELSCHICSANANYRRHFFTGVRSLMLHVAQGPSHTEPGVKLNLAQVLTVCKKRSLSDEDVRRIKAGEQPITPIIMRLPPNSRQRRK